MAGRVFPKVFLLLSALIFSLSMVSAETWTLMCYVDADNNLNDAGIDDVNEMEWCSDNPNVNIIVLLDLYGSGDSELYYVMHDDDMNNITSPTIDDGGAVIPSDDECDMSDWQTLKDFVDFCMSEYPADHYLLDLWDHGGGIFIAGKQQNRVGLFKGFCSDWTNGSGDMKLWEVSENVLNDISDTVDIIGFDTCILGQIETGYQFKDDCDYCIASEANEPFDGWNYNAFDIVRDDDSISPADLATEIVELYLDTEYNCTQACQDLTYLDSGLVPALNDFADELWANVYYYESDIQSARSGSTTWNSPNYDFYEFAGNIANDSDLPSSLRTSASDFQNAWDNYILAGGLHYNPPDQGYGATVWFPSDIDNSSNESHYINDIHFSDTNWDEFLYMYADPYPPEPVYLVYEGYDIDDSSGGNGNGITEPGETVDITVTLYNQGTDTANNVQGTLSTSDSYINITDENANFGNIASMGTGDGTFTFEVDGGCPDPYFTDLTLDVSADGGYNNSFDFAVVVGEGFPLDDVESGEGLWVHYGTNDQWHIETNRSHSPSHSWKCGGNGGGDYTSNMEAYLETPYIFIPQDEPYLEFWQWYEIEDGGSYLYDMAYLELHTSDKTVHTLAEYTGESEGWEFESVDLSAYSGELAKVVYHLHTDVSITYEGWYVDDIEVRSGSTSGVELITFDAEVRDSDIHLNWTVVEEDGVLGYNLYRRELVNDMVGLEKTYNREVMGDLSETSKEVSDYEKVNTALITGENPYRYIDSGVDTGVDYEYLLTAVMIDEPVCEVGKVNTTGSIPTTFSLSQNYPNPFMSETTVSFEVAESGDIEIGVYDISGRKVGEIANDYYEAGTYEVVYEGDGLKSGVYVILMKTDEFCTSKKMVIAR